MLEHPATQRSPHADGRRGGDLVIDFEFPEPVPAPVTTIAWRLGHVIVGVLRDPQRSALRRAGRSIRRASTGRPRRGERWTSWTTAYATWVDGVRTLGDDALARPVGPAEGPWAEQSYAELVLHINREVIHHCAEIMLLRDLYRHGAHEPRR